MAHTVEHVQPSPFPVETKQGKVTDEMCRCGHARSLHSDTVSFGHGPCVAICSCNKYTWASSIIEE